MRQLQSFEIGSQIAYIPSHADGEITHPNVEFGFIESLDNQVAYCRYWRRGQLGKLRTVDDSEETPLLQLVAHKSVSQQLIEHYLDQFDESARIDQQIETERCSDCGWPVLECRCE